MSIEARKYSVRRKIKWVVDLRGFDQGRHFFDKENEAKAFAESKSDLVRDFGRTAITALSSENLSELLSAKMRLVALGMTIDECITIAAQHRQSVSVMNLKEACELCVAAKKNSGKRVTYLRVLTTHLKSFRLKFGNEKSVHEIGGTQIEEWLNENGWAQATKKSVFTDCQTLFAFCIKRGWCKSNPCDGMEQIVLENKAPEIFTVDQCKRFMAAVKKLEPSRTTFFALHLFAGIRASEVAQLTKADIKEEHVEISALRSKTRQRRLVTINPTLQSWLKHKPDDQEIKPLTVAGMEAVKKAAGIKWKKNALRHSFVSYSLPIHGAQRTAMEAGHSERMLFEHYRELVTAEESKRFWKILP